MKDVLNELTDDETLKFVFAYAFGDYGELFRVDHLNVFLAIADMNTVLHALNLPILISI